MLNYSNIIRLIIIPFFILIFPYIQNQWYNLHLFSSNNFSFYYLLYYFSGILIPSLVILNSINYFTYYKFKNIKIDNLIKGKNLLIIIVFFSTTLSLLLTNYFFINFDFILRVFFHNGLLVQNIYINNIYIVLIISILLAFRKTKVFVKKLTLLSYFLNSLIIWHLQITNFSVDERFLINKYSYSENANVVNIVFLLIIEGVYYFWSFISYKNNLSDWSIPIPSKNDIVSILKIIFFYLLIIVYYSILEK